MNNLDSIKERISLYFTYLYSRWLFIVLIGILGGLLLYFYSTRKPTIYLATTIFHPETNESPSEIDLNNPASFITSTLGGNNMTANNQMIGVILSRRISEQVVGVSVEDGDSTILLADKIIGQFAGGFNLSIAIGKLLGTYKENNDPKLKIIQAGFHIRNSLEVITNEYGFIEMTLAFQDPTLAEETSMIFIEVIKEYYTEVKSEKSERSMSFLANRRDSVKTELDLTNQRIASFYDRNKYGVSTRPEIYLKEQEVKSEMLAKMYTELVIAFETTKAQYLKESPVIQVLDLPEPPFKTIRPKTFGYSILGVLIGLLIGILLVVGKLVAEDVQNIIVSALEEQMSGITISKEPPKDDS